ncbi:MAG: DUF167 domain-containing protein [Candidatus Omnitrophica bacterium]|nr:DUF167 domain-containing protein [Candidatus Omnitrophota bacterium]
MLVKVRVIPRAKKERVEEFAGGLKVYVCEPAQDGRANKKLIQILAKHYQTRKYKISIISGEKQRDKVIEINSVG